MTENCCILLVAYIVLMMHGLTNVQFLKTGRIGCPETSVRTTILRYVKSQKSEFFIYTAAKTWNSVCSSCCKYKCMDNLASTMKTHPWLKFTNLLLLFTMCIFACTQTPNIEFLNKGRPTWWHLLYYVNLLLNMFQMLIHPSSGACDYLVRYCVGCIVL